MCMTIEHITFIDCISFLPFRLRKMAGAYVLCNSKSWYSHFFNMKEHLNYVRPIPDVSYYGEIEMSSDERREFLEWYELKVAEVFDGKLVLVMHCQVTSLS